MADAAASGSVIAIPEVAADEWIGVDFDGTLAHYEPGMFPHVGAPIQLMVERVQAWLAAGVQVRIFTARVSVIAVADDTETLKRVHAAAEQHALLQTWCFEQFGQALAITCTKDYKMVGLWDDRAVQMIPNTGVPLAEGIAVAMAVEPV